MKRRLAWTGVIVLPVVVVGGLLLLSRDYSTPNAEWPTQMSFTAAGKSQSASRVLRGGMTQQMPVAGTIARGTKPLRYGPGPEEAIRAGVELSNPFEPTQENLRRGRLVYDNFCGHCHGAGGAGDGAMIPKYPNPPSFRTEKSRNIPDGQLFHIITFGRNKMPPHASLVSQDDRWKSILYIRTLQTK